MEFTPRMVQRGGLTDCQHQLLRQTLKTRASNTQSWALPLCHTGSFSLLNETGDYAKGTSNSGAAEPTGTHHHTCWVDCCPERHFLNPWTQHNRSPTMSSNSWGMTLNVQAKLYPLSSTVWTTPVNLSNTALLLTRHSGGATAPGQFPGQLSQALVAITCFSHLGPLL